MLPVNFASTRPVDGVEVAEGPPRQFLDETDSRIVRSRTDRLEPYDLQLVDLADPVVVAFVNAARGDRLAAFVAGYGWLQPGEREAYLIDLHFEARMIYTMALTATASEQLADRVRWLSETLERAESPPATGCSGRKGAARWC